MKKTKLLLTMGAVAGIAFAAAACSAYDPIASIGDQGYTLVISYDITAPDATETVYPTFGGRADRVVDHRYALAPGQTATYIVEPGSEALGETSMPVYAGHFLEGWYTDAAFTDKWDFAVDRAFESMTLHARWYPDFAFEVKYFEDGTEGVADTIVVSEGGRLTENTTVKREGYTLLGLYRDRECRLPWDFGTVHTGTLVDGEQKDRLNTVWSRWVKGDYVLVYRPEDLKMNSGGRNYLLMNDIDFTGLSAIWNASYIDFYGELNGAGHTIRNLTIPAEYGKSVSEIGLFGSLSTYTSDGKTQSAVLRDVTFENVGITMTYNGNFRATIGLLAGAVDAGVTFDNVSVDGVIDAREMRDIPSRNFYLGRLAGRLSAGTDGVVPGLTYRIDVLTDPAYFTVRSLNANEFELAPVAAA